MLHFSKIHNDPTKQLLRKQFCGINLMLRLAQDKDDFE